MITKIQKKPKRELQPCSLRAPFTTRTGWYVEPFVDGDGNEYEKATHVVTGGQPKIQWFKVGD